jgi:hypothetical protein
MIRLRCVVLAAALGATLSLSSAAWADDAMLTNLGLMRGHLRSATELTGGGDGKQAGLHYHHPTAELMAGLGAGGASLSEPLKALEAASDGGGDTKAALDVMLAEIGKLEAGQNTMPAIVGMLEAAAAEYAAAYPAGKLENLEEYQDSRGFVLQAADNYAALASKPAKAADIDAALAKLKTAWPAIQGPDAPVIDAAGVKALVDTIKGAAM